VWLAEGLLMYLEEAAVAALLEETAGAPSTVIVLLRAQALLRLSADADLSSQLDDEL